MIKLKKGREKSLLAKNHWVFSGAIDKADAADGEITDVFSSDGTFLGSGYYCENSQISVRMLSFGEKFSDDFLSSLVDNALRRREISGVSSCTDSYRLIFSEGDFLPGFIADNFCGHIVIQSLTTGMDKLKDKIISLLDHKLNPVSILEKSEHKGRELEGGTGIVRAVKGETPDEMVITEHEIKYPINPISGQKTGFFLDQRDNRKLISGLSSGKTVLNLFSYTGGFSFAAIKGGAVKAVSVDISAEALLLAQKGAELNGFSDRHVSLKCDVFDYIRNGDMNYDIVIIDPPAFVKSRGSVERGCRGYKDVNMNAMKRCPKGTLILSCSCSRFVDMDLFQKVLFAAAKDSGRSCTILGKFSHPADHPINIYNPETEYLKAVLLEVI